MKRDGKTTSDMQLLQRYFQTDPELSVALMLKAGVQRTFNAFAKQPRRSIKQVRRSIAIALDRLSSIDPSSLKKTSQRKNRKERTGISYFSRVHGGLVEYFIDKDTDKFNAQVFDRRHLPNRKPRKPRKQNANAKFKTNLVKYLESCVASEVEDVIFAGVCHVLNVAENFSGPFIDEFKAHRSLFEKLSEVYQTADAEWLDTKKGIYTKGMSVETTLDMDQRGEDEDDPRFEG